MFYILNVYSPNEENEQLDFLKTIEDKIRKIQEDDNNDKLIIGGDFNCPLDLKIDKQGGNEENQYKLRVRKELQDIIRKRNLEDIWRVRNPLVKRFTWRRRRPLIQSRIDFWLTSRELHEEIDECDIIASIRTDHSAITLNIESEQYEKESQVTGVSTLV